MYNPNNAKIIEKIPSGTICEGIIVSVDDGKPREFVKNVEAQTKFKNLDEPAINITIETKYDNRIIRIEQMFSYINGENNQTLYVQDSNIGKYVKQYGKLPTVSDKVKLISNARGFFKIIM